MLAAPYPPNPHRHVSPDRTFLEHSADSNLKRIVLECGGKNPAVAQYIVNGAL
ncbi:hypothetical protein [Burkholderia cenocepacia]|uniref:hypothetical protein n=1 Tax=Burkholderia cenocepacia TaxID=95486 RepID=UPI00163ABAB6|nr:hypothetical protein [Burkholderia cenocepacia]